MIKVSIFAVRIRQSFEPLARRKIKTLIIHLIINFFTQPNNIINRQQVLTTINGHRRGGNSFAAPKSLSNSQMRTARFNTKSQPGDTNNIFHNIFVLF